MGLRPSAVPTARTALGLPISRAIHEYGLISPGPISAAFSSTARWKSPVPRRSMGSWPIRPVARARSRCPARRPGKSLTGTAGRPKCSRKRRSNPAASYASSAGSQADMPRSLNATRTRPMSPCLMT